MGTNQIKNSPFSSSSLFFSPINLSMGYPGSFLFRELESKIYFKCIQISDAWNSTVEHYSVQIFLGEVNKAFIRLLYRSINKLNRYFSETS